MEPPSARSAEALHLQLRRRLAAWRAAGASPQVMRWLREGARCEWTSGPPPPYHHGVSFSDPGALSPEESAFLEKEVVRCFGTGAWETAPPDERTHVCRAHLVPKKGGKFRLVVDLRPTNAFCREFRCKYETLRNLSRLAGRGDWMFSWDLADGYHQIGVHADSRRYMTFASPPAPDAPAGAPPR